MNDIPLTDASFSEVLARVAYRLIERHWQKHAQLWRIRRDIWRNLIVRLERRGFHALAFWVTAYAYQDAKGETADFTRTAFIFRARMGYTFREVAYSPYKRRGKDDPRVTNRGVALPGLDEGGTTL